MVTSFQAMMGSVLLQIITIVYSFRLWTGPHNPWAGPATLMLSMIVPLFFTYLIWGTLYINAAKVMYTKFMGTSNSALTNEVRIGCWASRSHARSHKDCEPDANFVKELKEVQTVLKESLSYGYTMYTPLLYLILVIWFIASPHAPMIYKTDATVAEIDVNNIIMTLSRTVLFGRDMLGISPHTILREPNKADLTTAWTSLTFACC